MLEFGLGEAVFEPGDGRTIEGEAMSKLARSLAAMEDSLVALERRGISLRVHALRQDPVTLKLPIYHVYLGSREFWFTTRDELDKFLAQEEAQAGGELVVTDKPSGTGLAAPPAKPAVSETNGDAHAAESPSERQASTLHIVELHEVRTINNMLTELSQMGFYIQDLIPQDRTGTEEPRFVLRRGDHATGLEDLRGLLPAVRAAGERGLTVTRFKGLGEMNAEELRDTTLDPANRTLCQVTMRDAGAADELFRVLMGDKVEPRRDFIEKHALEVRNLDV